MIYLKIVLGTIRLKVATSVLFFISILTLVMTINYRADLMKHFLNFDNTKAQMSFVTDEVTKLTEIKNKLIVLPGVVDIQLQNESGTLKSIENLFKDNEIKEVIEESDLAYSKYIVTFAPNITSKSIKLIKSYIIKVLSNKEVVFSRVRGLKSKDSILKNNKSRWIIFYAFLSLVGLTNLILIHSLSLELKRLSYLYQRFQRRRYVSLKSNLLFFFIPLLLIFSSHYFLVGSLDYAPLLFFLGAFTLYSVCFNLKEYHWN